MSIKTVSTRKSKEVSCFQCGKVFKKTLDQIKKSDEKYDGRHFCCLKCVSVYGHEKQFGLSKGFGFYRSLAQKRAKKKNLNFDLTSEFLYHLYENQDGKCAVTGLKMILNKSSRSVDERSLYYASLDRVDNDKGYTKDNVQFVCLGVNYMRNTFSLFECVNFLEDISKSIILENREMKATASER